MGGSCLLLLLQQPQGLIIIALNDSNMLKARAVSPAAIFLPLSLTHTDQHPGPEGTEMLASFVRGCAEPNPL